MTALSNRYDFALFFDVSNGNPNGDPDAGNLPRMDPETSQGLVSDVSIKRKIRNYVADAKNGTERHAIYIAENAILNEQHRKAYRAVREGDNKVEKGNKLSPSGDDEMQRLRKWMCDNFFDVRTFGAVMSTGINCGQVRGPVQFGFGRSVDPIMPLEISITRMAATNEAEKKKQAEGTSDDDARGDNRTMGRKYIVPYGLYRIHGYVNAKLAEQTGFTDDDLALVKQALANMYDLDRSAARGEMASRRCIVFKHDSALGNASAHKLFDRIQIHRRYNEEAYPAGDQRTHNWPPARAFDDYEIRFNDTDMPEGVTAEEWIR